MIDKVEKTVVQTIAYMIICCCLFLSAGCEKKVQGFHFTVTGDMRDEHATFGRVLQSINNIPEVDGPGVFHVSPGDIDESIQQNRDVIDDKFGASTIWYPLLGNHEQETSSDMTWLRNEYWNANSSTNRDPLKDYTNQDGPEGSVETTYSWDYGNVHFISLNIYWNGGTSAGSDIARSGDIVSELYDWLEADLAANTKPFVFVFHHDPAFPYNHHYGDSLDEYSTNRDDYWALLEAENVAAVFVSHTHYYSKHQGDKRGHTYNYPAIDSWRTQDPSVAGLYGKVWQIDVGNSGKNPGGRTSGPDEYLPCNLQWNGVTFVDVVVEEAKATINVYRDPRPIQSDLGEQFSLYDSIEILTRP
jgi:hypothetical protein